MRGELCLAEENDLKMSFSLVSVVLLIYDQVNGNTDIVSV